METRTCVTCGETKEIKEFNLKDRNTGRRNIICRICENLQSNKRYHALHPLAKIRSLQRNNFHCNICGELKEPGEFHLRNRNTGRRNTICTTCVNLQRKELYHVLHPLAKIRSFQEDDFHCNTCGELKEPGEFRYQKGRRQGICKNCFNEKVKEGFHLKNPLMKYRVIRTEKFRCSKCGELRTPAEFYLDKCSNDVNEILMPCKICWAETGKIYRGSSKRKIDYDLYALFRHATGKYKVCPECGQEKHLSDFAEIRQALIPIHYVSNRYIICYRQIYSTCGDCRNRKYVLTERFVLNAF